MKKTAKGKKPSGGSAVGVSDDRFAHLQSDPKFSGLSNLNKKVVIEKRFAAALTDEKFSSRARVDKRGRRMKKTTGNDLLDLYEVEKDEDDEETQPKKKAKVEATGSGDEGRSDSDEGDDAPIKVDLARGEGNLSSSDDSDSDEESDWELGGNVQMEMDLAHLDQDAERVEWASKRLAACNLDWNLVKAEDMLILVNSFKPAGGRVERISIYLSDFGKERLAEEEKYGPRLQLSKPIEDYQDDEDIDPETRLAIRKYQLDLLKYYYAVIECDSEETATAIYEQCDGFQFESSGLKMDLRFVPDDMEFEEERLKERVTEADVNVDKYRSKENVKSGIASTDGRLAWDENDDVRAKQFQDAFSKDDATAGGLIADSDSEDDETVEKRRKALLSLLQGDQDDEGLQVEWEEKEEDSGVKKEQEDSDDSDIEKALARRDAGDVSDSEDEETADEVVPTTEAKEQKKNNFKNYLEKRKEKRRERKQKIKEAREAQRQDLEDVGKEAKKRMKEEKQRKAAKGGEEDEVMEKVAADDRFKALFTDSSFAIEQSAKEFKGSKLIEKQAVAKKENKEQQKTSTSDDLLSKLKQKANKWEQRKKK